MDCGLWSEGDLLYDNGDGTKTRRRKHAYVRRVDVSDIHVEAVVHEEHVHEARQTALVDGAMLRCGGRCAARDCAALEHLNADESACELWRTRALARNEYTRTIGTVMRLVTDNADQCLTDYCKGICKQSRMQRGK